MECQHTSCQEDVYENNKCIFHCEKDSWIEVKDLKDNELNLGDEIVYFWDTSKVDYFWNEFKELIEGDEELSKEDLYNRFTKFIFPKLEGKIFEDYVFKTDLIFNNSCKFMDSINFFKCTFEKEVYFNDFKLKKDISFVKSIFKDKFSFNNKKDIQSINLRFVNFEKKVEL